MSQIDIDAKSVTDFINGFLPNNKDIAGNYDREWLTQNYINKVFTAIAKEFENYEEVKQTLNNLSLNYEDISNNSAFKKITGGLLASLYSGFSHLQTPSSPSPNNYSSGLSSGGSSSDTIDSTDSEKEQTSEQQSQEQEQPTIENENLIAVAVGAIAFQTPITLYSTIGGESVQTSSETEYGLLGIENVDGTMYYKLIDKKTGKVYYAKKDDVKIEEENIQVLHTKGNALVLNSTDIGSDDNLVKLADPDSYYIVTDKQEINGVNFATVLDSETGKNYYIPIGDTVEVLAINQLENEDAVTQNVQDTNSNENIDNSSEIYSDKDIDVKIEDVTPNSDINNTNTNTDNSNSDTDTSDSNTNNLDDNNAQNNSEIGFDEYNDSE